MTNSYSSGKRQHLDRAVRVLCPLIEDRIRESALDHWREYDLRRELVGCILGSQVRYEMAVAATENMEHAGLFDDEFWSGCEDDKFEYRALSVLAGQLDNLPHGGCYRFPYTRAKQLTRARSALARMPMTARLVNDIDPKKLRRSLVADIPGLGPKQASMFLRNIGRSYDLAILDTHVLRFMVLCEFLSVDVVRIGNLTGYERIESVVVDYADSLGFPAGYLDWAIWATMKAAREIGL